MSLVTKLRTGWTRRRVAYLATAALFGLPTLAIADEVFVTNQTVSIPGLASFDISFVDPSLHLYFLADRSNKTVDVIDTNTKGHTTLAAGSFVGFTGNNDTSGPNGVMTVHQRNDHDADDIEVWAGDGNSTIKVIDLDTGTIAHTIATGGVNRADEMCWDKADHLAVVANDADSPPFISFISTDKHKIVKQLKFPEATNGIEQCQWNPRTGLIYLNIPEVNGPGTDTKPGYVYVIDPRGMFVIAKWEVPIADCAGPQGMAIGPAPQIALGCNAPTIPSGARNSLVINEETGKPIKVLANEGGTDEVWFNPGDGHYFFANSTPGSKTSPPGPQFLGIVDSRGDSLDATVTTATGTTVGSHSVAADPDQNQAYVPVAGGVAIYSPQGHDDRPVVVFRGDDDR